MKKLGYLCLLVVVLISSFVVGDIVISEPLDVYNLGDRLYVDTSGLVGAENGNLNINLVCGNKTTSLLKISARAFSTEEAQSYSIPYKFLTTEDLEIEDLNHIIGDCQIIASLGAAITATKTFSISNNVIVTATLNKSSYDPGEAITVFIDAVKLNGVLMNGFIEGANATSFSKVAEDGFAREIFSMPETIEAGTYRLDIRAYDVGRRGTLNQGSTVIFFDINQVATSIVMSLADTAITPGEEFTIGAEVYDQSGIRIPGIVAIEIVSPKGDIAEYTVPNDDLTSIDFETNSTPGVWTIIASFNDLSEAREFDVLEVQKIEFDFEDSVLTIRNTGNTLYNKSIDIQIGEETMYLDLNIKTGETRKFSINAPDGEYDVIIDDGENEINRQVLLTGNAVGVSDFRDVGFFRGYSILWIFLIVVLSGIGIVFFRRYKRTKTVGPNGDIHGLAGDKKGIIRKVVGKIGKIKKRVSGKVPAGIKSHVNDSMNFTNKSPIVQGLDHDNYSHEDKTMVDLTKKRVMSAESALVLKGEKHMSAVLALSFKNYADLNDVTKDTLHNAFAGAQKRKGLVDWRGDYVFVLFTPTITKTYRNEVLAVKEGLELLGILNEHNRKFRDKIEFNIGVHVGELVTSKEGGKLRYTSIGNTISLVKRISDSNSGKVIISEAIRKKLLRELKVVKAKEIGENRTYEVTEIKDRAADAAKLKELLKRSS